MSDFNPYREWLGIETATRPTYYELLGIAPGLSAGPALTAPRGGQDRQHIDATAQRLIRKLESVDCQGHVLLRDQLIRRIRRAASCLADDVKRAKYDRRLRQESVAQQARQQLPALAKPRVAPPAHRETGRQLQRPTSPPPAPPIPVPPLAAKRGPTAKAASRRPGESLKFARRPSLHRKRRTQHRRWKSARISLALAAISLLGVGYLVITQTGWWSALTLTATPRRGPSRASPLGQHVDSAPGSYRTMEGGPPQTPKSEDEEPASREPAEATSPPPRPADPAPPTAAELRDLGAALTRARSALSQHDFATATTLLDQAQSWARRPEDLAKLARLQLLAEYVSGYWKAVDDGFQQLQAGSEIEVAGRRMFVVERTETKLLLRANGTNTSIARSKLPLPLQRYLAERWLAADASSTKVFRGAMMAVSPEFTKEAARQLWREAATSGDIDLGDLELVLDDSYDLAP